MPVRAIFFDLDDTLIVDEAVSRETFEETGEQAARLCGANAQQFARDAAEIARRRWAAGPVVDYCRNVGISAFEGLWGDFSGKGPELEILRSWTAEFRPAVFDATLRAQEIEANGAEESLATHWAESRRKLARLMPDARETVVRLAANHSLGLLTNGAPQFQRDKFERSGLSAHFTGIVVSGDHGYGKPRPEVFQHLLNQLGVSANEAVMVGNSLERDIQGARNAGITSVWLRVPGAEEHHDTPPDHEIQSLAELPGLLEKLSAS